MRGIKVAISGKGGVGKSTVVATWSRLLSKHGLPVYAIDADPDANLAHALGMPQQLSDSMRSLAENDALVQERTGARRGETGQMFSLTPDVADISEQFAVTYEGVRVLKLGAIKKGGAGCACPESALLKSLVRHLVLHENEIVLLDMEAGVEHLGRATAMGVDALVIVVEPGSRSFETARHICALASDIGLEKKCLLLINKARDNDRTSILAGNILPGVPVLGAIPFDERFITMDEERKSVFDTQDNEDLLTGFKQTLDALTTRTTLRR
ncbi:MAG: AAA family ATPase [Chitinispirillaceae bacterium]|jgi:CO dehydrogenase maturation factor|nr:AAA family ATPase [Chitinispirillaceae bacterium]